MPDNEEFEKELRANKIEQIKLLTEQLVALNQEAYKEYKIVENKPIAYYEATIDILKKQKQNAIEGEAKLLKFSQTEQERKNLTPEELKQLQEEQAKINEKVDSFLATLEPRASLRGNIQTPNTIILRYRGQGIDNEFSKKYPFGVLL